MDEDYELAYEACHSTGHREACPECGGITQHFGCCPNDDSDYGGEA